LRRELRRLQHDTGLSTVLVTHDPEEAALLADEVLVMADGQLLQAGAVRDVYRRPASPRVAHLLGIQNLVAGTVTSPSAITAGGLLIEADAQGMAPGTEVLWCVRPEHVTVSEGGAYPATVLDAADMGAVTALTVRLDDGPQLRLRALNQPDLGVGDACRVDLAPGSITVWPTGGELIVDGSPMSG
jgi:ABC-type Fe3+/spermidine/putrescine transport system ATPase subunit